MEVNVVEDLAGNYGEDGSVKRRACMKQEDWENLRGDNIITFGNIEEGDAWIWWDCCFGYIGCTRSRAKHKSFRIRKGYIGKMRF